MTAAPIEVETNSLHMPEDRRHETVTRLFSLSINVESFGCQAIAQYFLFHLLYATECEMVL